MNSTDTRAAGARMADVTKPGPSLSRDLARSQGTDFFATDDLLTDQERTIRDRVRAFADDHLIPVANHYWERAEFPSELLPAYAGLGVAGGAIQGYGCPGMSPVAEGLVALELARGDGSFSTFNSVHAARTWWPSCTRAPARPASSEWRVRQEPGSRRSSARW